jgi:hypothetical protein
MLIAGGKLKSSICSLPGDVVPRLASIIQYPTAETDVGRQVINSLIPAITCLREAFHISFSTMFSNDMLKDYGLQSDLNSADLKLSDSFFDALPLKYALIIL